MQTTPEDTERWADAQTPRYSNVRALPNINTPWARCDGNVRIEPGAVLTDDKCEAAHACTDIGANNTRDAEEWSPLTTSRVEWVVIGVAIGVMLAAAAVYLWRVA